jgi:glycosyltransferase involved in cell wall biosynthesis
MKLGVINDETWAFFKEVYAELAEHHAVRVLKPQPVASPVFRERLNRYRRQRDLQAFLQSNDVVFFEWASERLAEASRLPKTCGLVTRLHRYELYQWAPHVRWEAVDRVILVSRAKQREFAASYPQAAHKTVVIPEAISLDRFQPRTRAFAGDLGILCNLSPRKRVYELILALAELNRQRPGFRLHIGGGPHPKFPEYASTLRALVQRLGLGDRVVFYDAVRCPEDWFSQIDIFISNSYSEGLQVSPMEAMASGNYCLSHAWDGADELLPAENLFYTDAELIAKVLEYADADEQSRRARRAALREMVCERFNVERIKVQIRQVVEETAQAAAAARS